MKTITVRRFSSQDSAAWNGFVKVAKNSTFLFDRNYMDYHSDRFVDHSIMLFEEDKLRAVLPAHEADNKIISHGGLTYGGLLLPEEAQLDEALRWFYHVFEYYHALHFGSMVYKCIPQHYCRYPSFEDQYVMFRLNAKLMQREPTCVFANFKSLPIQKREKADRARATCRIVKAGDPARFWNNVLIPNLQARFNTSPVHSELDIKMLMDCFPNNIQLYEVLGQEIMGGALVYETSTTAHLQYTSATSTGKAIGALDFLFHYLLTEVYASKEFFSFGTSNADAREINKGLMDWKESFGARVHTRDIYEIQIAHFSNLQTYA